MSVAWRVSPWWRPARRVWLAPALAGPSETPAVGRETDGRAGRRSALALDGREQAIAPRLRRAPAAPRSSSERRWSAPPTCWSPFERGWWLTAYLFLVGGLAQLLLVRGQEALTAVPHHPSALLVWAQWGLWNTGTAVVAVADMAQVMAVVDVGSVALLIALVLYHLGARRGEPTSDRPASALGYGYTALVVVLGAACSSAPSSPARCRGSSGRRASRRRAAPVWGAHDEEVQPRPDVRVDRSLPRWLRWPTETKRWPSPAESACRLSKEARQRS